MTRTSLRLMAGALLVLMAQGMVQTAMADPSSDVIGKYDTDKDKTLSLDEVKAAAAAHFDKLNKDGDPTLETKEVHGVLSPAEFKAADTDKDGSISKDEYMALVEKLFARADVDHDGTLQAAELRSKSGRKLQRLIN